MAVAKIEVMSKSKLTGIISFAIALQIIFCVVPTCFIGHSTDIIEPAGVRCSTNDRNNTNPICDTGMWYRSPDTAIKSYTSTSSLNGFGFQLPRLNIGKATDHSKWRPKIIGYLTVFMENPTANALPTFWNVNLLARRDVNTRDLVVFDAYYAISLNGSHPEKSTFDGLGYSGLYKQSTVLLEFESGLYDDYIVTVFNQLLERNAMQAVEMTLQLMIPNQQYLKFMMYLKIAFFVVAVIFCIWYRVGRSKYLGVRESAIHLLGSFLLFLDLPLELMAFRNANLTLLILKDIRTDMFYFALTSSCLIFVSDCIAKQRRDGFESRNAKPTLTLILSFLVTVLMTVFHSFENYQELAHPFVNLTKYQKIMGMSFIVALLLYAIVYTIYLTIKVSKGVAYTADMPNNNRYNRSSFLLLSSLFCVTFTLIDFITCELTRYQTKWSESVIYEVPVGLSVGVFSTWNIYALLLLYLYAPKDEESTMDPNPELMPPPSYDEFMFTINNPVVSAESKKEKEIITP